MRMMFDDNEDIILHKEDIDTIVKQSMKQLPNEACGLIGAEKLLNGGIRLNIFPTPNKSNIVNRFFIPHNEIKIIEAKCRFLGYDLCGCYHSHTKGSDVPSIIDILSASKSKFKVWVIYSVRLNRLSVYDMDEIPTKMQYQIV